MSVGRAEKLGLERLLLEDLPGIVRDVSLLSEVVTLQDGRVRGDQALEELKPGSQVLSYRLGFEPPEFR